LTVTEQFAPLTAFRGSSEKLSFIRNHFSVREFGSLEELLIVPFHKDDSIIGLLLVAESKVNYTDQTDFLMSRIDRLSEFMYESRELFYTKPSGTVYSPEEAYEEAEALIDKAHKEENSILAVKLDIASLIDNLESQLDRADGFRLRKDVMGIISSMIQGNGKVIYTSDAHTILLIQTRSLSRGRLLLHQIYQSLNSYFSLSQPLPSLSSSERFISGERESAQGLLDGLI